MTFWARATRVRLGRRREAIFRIEVPTSVVAALTFSADRWSSLAESATTGRGVLDVAHQLAEILLHVADGGGELVDLVLSQSSAR